MIEIERKFKVNSDAYKDVAFKQTKIIQGFLNRDPERTVRVRIRGENGYLTVKGKSNQSGTSRFEWEKEIPKEEAQSLISLCEKGVIEKIRYEVNSGNHIIEIDEFFLDNEGLTVAEIELKEENETFEKPSWLGEEVTGDIRYYNSSLSKKPFKTWKTN